MRVKVLVLPVYRRHWLYHAWVDPNSYPQAGKWEEATTWSQKFHVVSDQVNNKFNSFVSTQWAANAAAKEGTFRSWMHKLALAALSRENPVETFLKRLPRSQAGTPLSLEVMYPAGLDPTLVRRRLRLIGMHHASTHRRALVGWTLACLPQLPLALTPLPNVTLYYAVYRAVSHYRAWGGASTLEEAYANPDSRALQKAVEGLLGEESEGGKGVRAWLRHDKRSTRTRAGELRPDQRLEVLLQQLGTRGLRPPLTMRSLRDVATGSGSGAGQDGAAGMQQGEGMRLDGRPVVVMLRSQALDEAVRPLDRWVTPLDDSAVAALAAGPLHADVSGLDEHLARVRRMALDQEGKRDRERGRTGGVVVTDTPSSSAPHTRRASGSRSQQDSDNTDQHHHPHQQQQGRVHAVASLLPWPGLGGGVMRCGGGGVSQGPTGLMGPARSMRYGPAGGGDEGVRQLGSMAGQGGGHMAWLMTGAWARLGAPGGLVGGGVQP